MAYLRILSKQVRGGKAKYYYILESYRDRTGRGRTRVKEYLGRDPDKKRLAAALKYWKVDGTKKKAKKR